MRPCLAIPAAAPPKGERWVHEAKWDGYRCQIVKDGTDVRLYSKSGADWTKRMPSIAADLAKLPASAAILDTELCYCGPSGRPDFRALMAEMRRSRPDPFHLVLYAFDLMHLDGADLRSRPLQERRRTLARLLRKPLRSVYLVDQFSDGDDLMHWCERYRLEGVVSKRIDSIYVSGETSSWVKSKCETWKAENRERWRTFQGPLAVRDPNRDRR